MTGDVQDFIWRQLTLLPVRWFSNGTPQAAQPPFLTAVLAGFATAWAALYSLLGQVQALARIRTAFGAFLDMIAVDFIGAMLARRPNEPDDAFRLRILQELLRPRVTRDAMTSALTELTGKAPVIFEPARPADTGSYNSGGCWYGAIGGWGNLQLPYASFITAYRPAGQGIALFAGYGTGGLSFYGDLSMVATPVTDAMIFTTCAAVLPAGYVGWLRIANP